MIAHVSGWEVGTALGTIGAAIFAAASAGVAAWSARTSARFYGSEQERLGKASIGASIRSGPSGHYCVRVWNNGPGIAREMRIDCDLDGFLADTTEMPPVMGPGQPADVGVTVGWSEAIPQVTVYWHDEREDEQHLDVPKRALPEP